MTDYKTMPILVVDDDPHVRELLKDALMREGHEVVEASNGDLGIASYRAEGADVVITDLLIPVKEGMEMIRELQKEDPNVKVIAISGGGIKGADYLPLAKDLGAVATLQKPFRMQEMIEAVENAL